MAVRSPQKRVHPFRRAGFFAKTIDFFCKICYTDSRYWNFVAERAEFCINLFEIMYTGAYCMISRDVTITNTVGLHARPATFFIQKANSYRSSIWVEREDRRVNAKSLLGVLSLGIVKGTTITLIADGADEEEALSGLAELVDTGFNE
jgi:phosphocarrier protein